MSKNISKTLSGKYSQKRLEYARKMRLKLLQKEQFRKQQKQLVIWLVIKLLTGLQKFQKIHSKII